MKPTKGFELFIVEDEHVLRDIVVNNLNVAGYKVKGFCCGDDALKYFKGNPVRIVVTDMNMKNGNGLELIKGLAQLQIKTAIIVMSAHPELLDELSNIPCVRRVHAKPINMADLIEDIESIIDRKEWDAVPTRKQLGNTKARLCVRSAKSIQDFLRCI